MQKRPKGEVDLRRQEVEEAKGAYRKVLDGLE